MAAADVLGGVRRAVALTNPDWLADYVSSTFHGRDVFTPVAARLAGGDDLAEAGDPVDPSTLVRLPEPVVSIGEGVIEAEVLTVDRFGNVQLAAPGSALNALPRNVRVGGTPAVNGATFADAKRGELVVYTDSADRLAIALNGGRAVVGLGVQPGDIVRIAAQ